MKLNFISPLEQKPGTIFSLLNRSYADLFAGNPDLWKPEKTSWEKYDHDVYKYSETVGSCIFLSVFNNTVVGFASWDPRQKPQSGRVGHNCILPEFRGKGFGKQQILEIIRQFQIQKIQSARSITCNHPFFLPAQHMYKSCGFQETQHFPWARNPEFMLIEYLKEILPNPETQI